MELKEMSSWNIAVRSLRRRKTRTALTVSGIVVGVAMILVLLSLAAGTSTQTSNLLRSILGAEVTVVNGTAPTFPTGVSGRNGGFFGGGTNPLGELFGFGNTLNESIISQIEGMPGVYAISAQLSITAEINGTSAFLYGIDPSTFQKVTGGLNIVNGTALSATAQGNEMVLEGTLAANLEAGLGSVVSVKTNYTEANYTVVGIYSAGSSFGPQARSAYVALANAQSLSNEVGQVSEIYVKTTDPNLVNQVATLISSSVAGVRVITANSFANPAATLSSTLTTFFSIIGLVALLAGAFGVVNTMFMSISERTREIGTLKAIGAKGGQVMRIFMSEALIIGLLGGGLGVAIGTIVTFALPSLVGSLGLGGFGGETAIFRGTLQPALTAYNLLLSFGLGALVGLVAGAYPAWRASKMNPVEALRHV
jgi:putative ABC transport system permease protein